MSDASTLAPPAGPQRPPPAGRTTSDGPLHQNRSPGDTPVTEADVLALAGPPLAEWVDGRMDELPMPTPRHQSAGSVVYDALLKFSWERRLNAAVRFTGLPVRIPAYAGHESRIRYPDVVMLKNANDPRAAADAWNGADLVVEVVSPDDPLRDTRDKRLDYAAAGVPEYWIVDPRPHVRTVSVLTLGGGVYADRVFGEGERAGGVLLPDFTVDVTACFNAR